MLNKAISVGFRLLLMSYGLLILFNGNNIAPWWAYALYLIIYMVIFAKLRRESSTWYSIGRLINDYLLISLILYKKEPSIINICYPLLPIINSSNYTGSYTVLASLRLYGAALISFAVLYGVLPSFEWLIPLSFFWIVSIITKGREFVKNMRLILANPVGQINIEQITPYSTHRSRILREVIEQFNKNKFLKLLHPIIKIAVCFKLKPHSSFIVSSSELITNYKFNESELYNSLETLKQNNFNEFIISINKSTCKKEQRLIHSNQVGDSIYLYYVEFERPILEILIPFINSILAHTFYTLSTVFEIEETIKRRRIRLVKRLKRQSLFLENSTYNIHFVNNKLTPIREYFSLRSALENNEIPSKPEIEHVLGELYSKSKVNVGIIVDRLVKHLDKQHNPLYSPSLDTLLVEQIILSVTRTWSEHDLSIQNLKIDVQDINSLKLEKKIASEHFDIILDEIIENMIKYRANKYGAQVVIFTKQIVFRFYNDIKLGTSQTDELAKLTKQFNDDNLSEMVKRTSHGIPMIKKHIMLMGIHGKISLQGNNYIISLTLDL